MVIILVFGLSLGVIALAWGIDNGFEIYDEWRADRKLKKVRSTVENRALQTLAFAFRIRNAVVSQNHHGSHRRMKAS